METSHVRHARIEDLDKPLHRIFPVWRFEEVCRLRRLTLVKPSAWPDPREDPCKGFLLMPQVGAGFQKPPRQLADYLSAAWAQCWSYEADSDVLLRAYSRVVLDPISKRNTTPAEEGVRVTTTARHLLAAMEEWGAAHLDHHFYLAGVRYEKEPQFGGTLVNRLAEPDGPRYFSTPDGRAESLCTKRDQFKHEDEVRMLCLGPGKLGTGEELLHFPINPNVHFTEVSFDPRLTGEEPRERQERLRGLGYEGPFRDDDGYRGAVVRIELDHEWLDPID